MFSEYFYHSRIKRCIGAFGSLFNNIYIMRKTSNNKGVNPIKVPIAFGPKRKFLERLEESLKNEVSDAHIVAITLPRMSFEIIGINYDFGRQLPRTNFTYYTSDNVNKKKKMYTKTPYSLLFQLTIYAKTHDDALQVVEQILPYFTPTYTLKTIPMNEFPEVTDDIPVTMNSITFSDDYEGPMEVRRTILYILDFEMKVNMFGPISEGNIIRQADVTYFLPDDSDYTGWERASKYTVTTNPPDASEDSAYTFVETLTIYGNGDSDSG